VKASCPCSSRDAYSLGVRGGEEGRVRRLAERPRDGGEGSGEEAARVLLGLVGCEEYRRRWADVDGSGGGRNGANGQNSGVIAGGRGCISGPGNQRTDLWAVVRGEGRSEASACAGAFPRFLWRQFYSGLPGTPVNECDAQLEKASLCNASMRQANRCCTVFNVPFFEIGQGKQEAVLTAVPPRYNLWEFFRQGGLAVETALHFLEESWVFRLRVLYWE
jgi:hypothetical protein